jgi:hypothetical protein
MVLLYAQSLEQIASPFGAQCHLERVPAAAIDRCGAAVTLPQYGRSEKSTFLVLKKNYRRFQPAAFTPQQQMESKPQSDDRRSCLRIGMSAQCIKLAQRHRVGVQLLVLESSRSRCNESIAQQRIEIATHHGSGDAPLHPSSIPLHTFGTYYSLVQP